MKINVMSATLLLFSYLLCFPGNEVVWAQVRGPHRVDSAPPIPDVSNARRYQPFDKTPLKFTARSYYVLVPVIVRSKDGKHVPGLTKDSFEIFENGKAQNVASVDEISTSVVPVTKPHMQPNEFSNETSPISGERRITVIAIDLVNTRFLDQTTAREAVLKYLAQNATPDSLYQLVTLESNGMHIVHDFTTDTEVLLAALKKASSRFGVMESVNQDVIAQGSTNPEGSNSGLVRISGLGLVDLETSQLIALANGERAYGEFRQSLAVADTLNTFQQIALRLYNIPGRKSLLWVTGSFPFTIDIGSAAISEGISWESYLRAVQVLNNANIALYPIDARGLVVAGQLDASVHLTHQGAATQPAYLGIGSKTHQDTLDTMRMFASMTGGKAYFNTNDLPTAIKDAIDDGSAYYMLSYPLDKSDTKPGWRKIKVNVKHPDVRVRAREGYFVSQMTLDPSRTRVLDLGNAMNSPLDYTGIPVHVKLEAPSASGNKKKIGFSVLVPGNAAVVDDSDNNRFSFEVVYAVRNAKGEDVAHKAQAYNLNLNATMLAQLQNSGLGYNDTVELPPGDYNLHVVVRDNIAGKVGSVWAPIKLN